MIKSEKRLFAIELILSMIFLLNIFLKNILNDYFVVLILLIAIAIIIVIMGYEPDKNLNRLDRKKLLFYVAFYCTGFLIFEYGLGLFLGYVENPYKRSLFAIFSNTFSTLLIIFSSECLRYMIVKKGENNKLILVFTIVVFMLIDLTLNVKYYDLGTTAGLLEYSTAILLPSFFKNFMLSTFTYRYGMMPSILYRLIMELYIYIVPTTPDLGIYLDSVLLMIFPMILNRIVNYGFEKEKRKDYNSKNYFGATFVTLTLIFALGIVALNSNLFRFWMAAVGSGSMVPTLNVGDVIIVDKGYQKHLDKLNVGDILVFKIGRNIYTHRIIKIDKKSNEYNINTQGDRKGQPEDSWTVTNNDIIGVVKYKIKYIGYPTVWLSRILEKDDE